MSSLATISPAASIQQFSVAVRPAVLLCGFRWKWLLSLLIAAVLSPGLLVVPPVWHGALRQFLTLRASRGGYDLSIERISGGVFGDTRLGGIHVHQTGASTDVSAAGTDLSAKSVQFAAAWRLPWFQGFASWMREIRVEGVGGTLNLPSAGETLQSGVDRAVTRWLPASFVLQVDDLQLVRGGESVRLSDFLLSGNDDAAGEISVREIRVAGPDSTRVLGGWRGETFWKDNRLTVTGVTLGDGVSISRATLDASQLGHRRLEWDANLIASGGEVRSQGAVCFNRDRAAVEVAATLRRLSIASLARTMGIRTSVDGEVNEASFTLRGNPEDLSSAQMWLSARVTGFRWEDRRWESLDARAVVVNQRVQLHRFDLRQQGNRLSVSGELPLPPADVASLAWTGEGSWWQAAGFSCRVDARLEDLHALSELAGTRMPDLAGRMSINGQLTAAPCHPEIEGYLNVEGTRLLVCGAPLDFLRSTLLFRNGAVEVADVQATHDMDYLTAHGAFRLSGAHADRHGEARAEIRDLSVYASALAGLPSFAERTSAVRRLDAVVRWENGDLFYDQWNAEPAGFMLAR